MEDNSTFNEFFPDEVLFLIFSFLDSRSLVCVSETCKRWNRIANDEKLWHELHFCEHLPAPSNPKLGGKTWKRTFIWTVQLKNQIDDLDSELDNFRLLLLNSANERERTKRLYEEWLSTTEEVLSKEIWTNGQIRGQLQTLQEEIDWYHMKIMALEGDVKRYELECKEMQRCIGLKKTEFELMQEELSLISSQRDLEKKRAQMLVYELDQLMKEKERLERRLVMTQKRDQEVSTTMEGAWKEKEKEYQRRIVALERELKEQSEEREAENREWKSKYNKSLEKQKSIQQELDREFENSRQLKKDHRKVEREWSTKKRSLEDENRRLRTVIDSYSSSNLK